MVITKVEVTNQTGTVITSTIENIPDPTTFDWSLADISGPDAGRRLNSDMFKNLKAKARTLDLTWVNRNSNIVATALAAFNHEYMWVTFYDALEGKAKRKHFYSGDKSASMYSAVTSSGVVWSVARIKLIQSVTDKV
jgi:hypothetical protein